jgi:hypothetical protein
MRGSKARGARSESYEMGKRGGEGRRRRTRVKMCEIENALIQFIFFFFFFFFFLKVLCPAILIKQWMEEIEKNTHPHLNVVVLASSRDIKSCTYLDIFEAGIFRGNR